RFQVTSFSSDWRFDTAQSVRLTEQLQKCGVDADHAEIHSPYGHDSFLLDPPGYLDRVNAFLSPDAG
ncbi:homoserine O-acetyltransferase, partial [Nocardioides sp. SOB44]|nr:homoserine O-acetyltransferase [Nocardioides cremeus]